MGHLGVTHGVVTNSYRSRVVTTSIYPFVFGLKVTQVKFVGKFCSAIIDPWRINVTGIFSLFPNKHYPNIGTNKTQIQLKDVQPREGKIHLRWPKLTVPHGLTNMSGMSILSLILPKKNITIPKHGGNMLLLLPERSLYSYIHVYEHASIYIHIHTHWVVDNIYIYLFMYGFICIYKNK